MPSPLERGLRLLADYGAPDASVADILCDRHDPAAVAFTVVDTDLSSVDLTYGELRAESTAFAAGLAELGVGPGDRVATLMGKGREQLVALLGIWRLGAVHVPLFTAFAPPAVATRLDGSGARVVICDPAQRSKVGTDPWRVVVTGGPPQETSDVEFGAVCRPGAEVEPVAAGGEAPMVQIYTSGTTGRPKGVVIPVKALATWQIYLEYGLDVAPDDVYWCAADPGWTYGLYSAVIAPLVAGRRALLVRPQFSPAVAWGVLDRYRVTNMAAAPTIYRAMRAAGRSSPVAPTVRRASSAGEPLTPEVNEWAPAALGCPVHDHYGQTETGMVINNHHHPDVARPLRAGSMGHAMPGWTAQVLQLDRDEPAPVGTLGRIAFDLTASPLAYFTGYVDEPAKTAEKVSPDGRWYLTGDTGLADEDGYLHFQARDDDVIIMAGYRIGPFDIESILAGHPAVVECAVIAAPDAIRGEVIEAYVVLREGATVPVEDLQQLVREGYGAHAYPRTIHFVPSLPKTESGKMQRHILRQRRRAELAGASS
jgi:acetyl-CoA synthetase